jgi:DEAD/DEAH box helicase domain-containing protein
VTIEAMLEAWSADDEAAQRIVHVERVDPAPAVYEDVAPPIAPAVAGRLAARGVTRLYRHQAQGIRRVREGRHTVVVAGTASGKSLVYQVPIAEAVDQDPGATALGLFPTKALAQDQLRSFSGIGGPDLVAATYDGDTDPEARRWVRRNANVVLTNPDMLHVGILPSHERWGGFFGRLRFVVVDELHVLRGIFGSHVAHVLRRLRRVARHHGADPTFVFASATIGNPGELAQRLLGLPVEVVDQDTSPSGAKVYVLWNPELEDAVTGRRASSLTESTRVFTDLVGHDLHTLVFSRSRKASELMFRWARDRLDPERAKRIASYRGGYLAKDRRRIEQALFSGELLGVTATNALELGIDVGGLDAAVITTFPGTIASFRQQAGRSGRNQREAMVVLVAGQDALDQYYVTHPEDLFSRPAEAAVVNPANPEILAAHIGCAAHEIPLVPDDRDYLGEELEEAVPDLVAAGRLAVRGGRLLWAGGRSPAAAVDIRTSGGPPYVIADHRGDLLGSVDEDRAFSQCHAGAVYLHQGDTYVVEHLDLGHREVRVRRGEVGYYTQPKIDKDVRVLRTEATGSTGRLGRAHGWVEVETHVLAYQRKEIGSGRVVDTLPLDLPSRTFRTQAFWYTFPDDLFSDAGAAWNDLPGILHAAEHTAIAVMPIYAMCDRWDIGGLSTAHHPDAGGAVFYVYDGYPGGAGIAPIGYAAGERHLRATLAVLEECPCAAGCPSCVQSPKCGNFNEPLDKDGAARVLRLAVAP